MARLVGREGEDFLVEHEGATYRVDGDLLTDEVSAAYAVGGARDNDAAIAYALDRFDPSWEMVIGEATSQRDAEIDRLTSDLEAERAGTAGMVAYTRTLEGLLRRVADAWNSDGDEAGDNLVAIGEVVDEWEQIDPERQG